MRINGRPGSQVDAADRGLAYGDGLFETIAVARGRPLLWADHLQRLGNGCQRLGLPAPDPERLLDESRREIGRHPQGVLKITLTRGSGPRGYRPPAQPAPTLIVEFTPRDQALHHSPQPVQVRMCSARLGWNPLLAGLKHLNRLEQVMARREWDDPNIFEGLMLDQAGDLIEGTMSNLFLWRNTELLTPDLRHCGVAGVARQRVLRLAEAMGISVAIRRISPRMLLKADGLLLTNSLMGYRLVSRVDDHEIPTNRFPKALLGRIEADLFEGEGASEG